MGHTSLSEEEREGKGGDVKEKIWCERMRATERRKEKICM